MVSPPCMSEDDRYSLEALRSIHQMMDDDKDGGIEVEESVEVHMFPLVVKVLKYLYKQVSLGKSYTTGAMTSFRVECYFRDSNSINTPLAH